MGVHLGREVKQSEVDALQCRSEHHHVRTHSIHNTKTYKGPTTHPLHNEKGSFLYNRNVYTYVHVSCIVGQ